MVQCVVCKSSRVFRCPITSIKTGDFIHLCEEHLKLKNAVGWYAMAEKFETVSEALADRGFYFNAFKQLRRNTEED